MNLKCIGAFLFSVLFTQACMAQTFEIEGFYGIFGPSVVYEPLDGPPAVYIISAPNFVTFRGLEWDAARDRVVLLTIYENQARIGSLNPTLDPGSLIVLRSGLDVGASQIDVDPATGRLYWWENGEILSVESDGTGVPEVEAENVAEPRAMEIDTLRNRYFILPIAGDELEIGPLGVPGTAQAVPLLLATSVESVGDIAIDPISGDLLWNELSGSLLDAQVLRANSNGVDAQVVYQNDTPPVQKLDWFGGLGVIGDQLGVIAYDPFAKNGRFIDVNLTSGLGVEFPLFYSNLFNLDIVFSASPIIEQPVSLLVDVGQQAALNTASFDPNASYQWRRVGMNLVDDARISGTTTDTLTINDAQLTDTNAYTCVVVDSTGAIEESVAAILAVRGDAAQTCTADLNGDSELNFFDVSVFLSAYSAGCP